MSGGNVVLPFGKFYGRVNVRRSAPGLDFALLSADPNRIVERHSHEDAHFVFVIDGLYASSASGADAIANSPMLIFNPAGTTHRDRFEAQARVCAGRFLTLSVSADVVAAASDDGRVLTCASVLRDADALLIASRIARACSRESGDDDLLAESLAFALTQCVVRARGIGPVAGPAWLALADELLCDACDTDLRIADLAAVAGVHPVHFARVYRHYRGRTPGDFLRSRRIERASTLLRDSSRSLSEIAASCGFSDQSHFSNQFRRQTGRTPAEYRRSARDGGDRATVNECDVP